MTVEAAFPFLKQLSREGRQLLHSELTRLELKAKAVFLHEGDPVRSLLLLESGCLRVFKVSASGRELTLYRVRAGEVCVLSVSGLLADASYTAEVVASESSVAHALPAAVFRRLFETEPAMRRLIIDVNNRLLTGLMSLVSEVAFRKMDERLAAFLLSEAAAHGRIETTHEQIAAHLGTAREVVSRLLENFRDDGWVRIDRKTIELTDRAALEQLL